MKNQNKYNRFILFANAPVCAYGNLVVLEFSTRAKQSLINKLAGYFLLRRASG